MYEGFDFAFLLHLARTRVNPTGAIGIILSEKKNLIKPTDSYEQSPFRPGRLS